MRLQIFLRPLGRLPRFPAVERPWRSTVLGLVAVAGACASPLEKGVQAESGAEQVGKQQSSSPEAPPGFRLLRGDEIRRALVGQSIARLTSHGWEYEDYRPNDQLTFLGGRTEGTTTFVISGASICLGPTSKLCWEILSDSEGRLYRRALGSAAHVVPGRLCLVGSMLERLLRREPLTPPTHCTN